MSENLSLAAIKALRAAITPGEWVAATGRGKYGILSAREGTHAHALAVFSAVPTHDRVADTKFCAQAPAIVDWLVDRLEDLEGSLREIRAVVNRQAEDEGLWSLPLIEGTQPIMEAYLQQELRHLHKVIEDYTDDLEVPT